MEYVELVWNTLNSPLGLTLVGGLLLFLLNKLYAKKPGWAKYEGAIVAGIKFAEKNIPDGTPSKGMARLDNALKFVLRVYEEREKKAASAEVRAEMEEGIALTHARLESEEVL